MPKYLTPQQVRAGGTGLTWTGVANAVLADLIDQAEQEIDAHMGFAEDDSLGFLPGTRTERQPWSIRSNRVYPRCQPVPISQLVAFSIVVSQTAADGAPVQAVVPVNLVVLNNDLGYLEVIDEVVTEYGLLPVLVGMGVGEPFASFTYVAGYSIQKTTWPLYDSSAPRLGSAVYHSFRPNWDTVTQVPIIAVDGVVADPATYTLNGLSGTVTFAEPVSSFADVSATFLHTIPDVVTKATRKAFLEAAYDYAINTQGLAGLDQLKSGLQEMRRRKKDIEDMTWREMLDGLKPFHMAPATGTFR